MSYIIDRTIQTYIDEERQRCAALVEQFNETDFDFLMYCIKAPVHPGEDMDHHRKRFEELTYVSVADPIDELM